MMSSLHLYAADVDYESRFFQATLNSFSREVCMTVQTIDDDLGEAPEMFNVFLNIISDPVVSIGRSSTTGTIVDNEGKSEKLDVRIVSEMLVSVFHYRVQFSRLTL